MFCPQCGTANPEGARFCSKCGAGLQATAPPVLITPAPSQQNVPPSAPAIKVQYAGFWRRFGAIIIDGLILSVVLVPLRITSVFTPFGIPLVFSYVLSPVIGWLYFALMESSKFQGTLGKMALGIIVTDMEGRRVSFGKATGRYFGKLVSTIILFAGLIMIAFTEKKQGLHDMLANCLVITKG